MKQKQIKHHMDGLLALLLFGVFAACILIVLLTGADAYRRLTRRDQAAFDRRTCVQYVATRVRQSDVQGGVTVENFGGVNALALWEEGYVTYIYFRDGWLTELYCMADADMAPEDGERVMETAGLEFSLEDGLLTVAATDAGGERTELRLSLRSAPEGRTGAAGEHETTEEPPEQPDDLEADGVSGWDTDGGEEGEQL